MDPVTSAASRPRAEGDSLNTFSSDFQRRERERVAAKVKRYDEIADFRIAHEGARAYYADELLRLVRKMVTPGSRILEIGTGLGDLLAGLDGPVRVGIDISPRMISLAKERHPELDLRVLDVENDDLPEGPFDYVILSDAIGHLDDIQRAFERIRPVLAPSGRVVVTYYNYLWEPLLKTAEAMGIRAQWPAQNWLNMGDLENLLNLSDYEVVRQGTDVLMPMAVPGVSEVMNRVAAKMPVVREGALVSYFVARPIEPTMMDPLPGVTIIAPCRNEKGNIREAALRTPLLGPKTELIFVDGHSSDGTVEEIEALIRDYKGPLEIRLLHQEGKGKGDAVRLGFQNAKYDVLMILDTDLTVPPEDLPKFYRALVTGKGEFINGVRLVYPMEGQAMRFLNRLGNKFFSLALSWLLEQPIKDSLCGTKVLLKKNYDLIAENRAFFGEFDPFGDFDLLFGAARLNMKITDLPVRYRARTYGDTKIDRFAHGWLLLKMTAFGFKKFKMGL